MEINEKLFENIIVMGSSGESDIFDQIEDQEKKIAENKDLYDAFSKITKVLESPSTYNEIQSVAPSLDVNNGTITVNGVCKHSVKACSSDMGIVDGDDTSSGDVENIITSYVKDLTGALPDGLKLTHEIFDDETPALDKKKFLIIISRK